MTQEDFDLLNQKFKVITYNPDSKKLYTNAIRDYFVQGENKTTAVLIVGPPKIKAISLLELRMAIRVSSKEFETTVEKTLETQQLDDETIGILWEVGKEETSVPGNLSVSLIGYGGSEEVIKITSDGIVVKADDLEEQAPPESTWNQILSQVQSFATQAAQSKNAAKESEQIATEKAAEATASAATAAQKATEAISAAATAAQEAATLAAAETEEKIRGFADDRYARALVTTEGPAESLTIYPDEGSNIAITSHGYTEQSGSGDPSPTNVRPIKVGGIRLNETIFDGSENWVLGGTEEGQTPYFYLSNAYSGELVTTKLYSSIYRRASITQTNSVQGVGGYGTTCYIRDTKYSTVEELKAALQANPLSVWYGITNGTGFLYTITVADGAEYRCKCVKINQCLCKDDKLETSVPSGCDVDATFDGSEDENWSISGGSSEGESGSKRFFISISKKCNNSNANTTGRAFSDLYPQATPVQTYGVGYDNAFSVQDFTLHLRIAGISTVEALRQHLSARPLIVRYRSTAYLPKNDKQVCLEQHKRGLTVVDGTSTVFEQGDGGYKIALSGAKNGAVTSNRFSDLFVSGGVLIIPEAFFPSSVTNLTTANQWVAENPVQLEHELSTPIAYAHDPIRMEANPKVEDGSIKVSGEKTVSAIYNKALTKAIQELQAAMLALGSNLSM